MLSTMKQNEVIAWVVERTLLRSVRYLQRGRDNWQKCGGGVWPIEEPIKLEQPAAEVGATDLTTALDAPASDAQVIDEEAPLVRVMRDTRDATNAKQVVLGLPLSRLLVQVLKFPIEMRDNLAEAVELQLDKLSPFPGEELAVSHEVLGEDEQHLWVLAAAMPAISSNALHEALAAAHVRVGRTDIALLGWIRSLCGELNLMRHGRLVLLSDLDDGWELIILDHGIPVFIRGLGSITDNETLVRELTLSILNAEIDIGHTPILEWIVLSQNDPDATLIAEITSLVETPVRHVKPQNDDGGVDGVALRTVEGASLNLTPQLWKNEIYEATIRQRMLIFVSVAAALWVLIMGTLFAGPFVYKQLTNRTRALSTTHSRVYRQVSNTRERVNLISKYMDRSDSPLEILRQTATLLPETGDVTWNDFFYKKGDNVKISGVSREDSVAIQYHKDIAAKLNFATTSQQGPKKVKDSYTFSIEGKFNAEEKK